jgi:hypothetical protein
LPFGLISFSWESPLLGLALGTSLEHPNKVHKYAKVCHLNTTSKSISSCHQAHVVSSSSLERGFWFNLSTFRLTLPTLWITSKSYTYRISAHMINFLMSQFNSIKNLKG